MSRESIMAADMVSDVRINRRRFGASELLAGIVLSQVAVPGAYADASLAP